MAFVFDTFTDTDGTDLTAHTGETGATWAKVSGVTGVFKITGNTAKGDSGGISQYYASGTPATAEYDVEADIHFISNVDYPGVGGRINGSTDDGYYITYNDALGTGWILFKNVSGTPTSLGTYADAFTSGDRHIKLEIRDAAKKVFIDGVERISSADNTITAAGKAGIRTRNSDWGFGSTGRTLDNFTATGVSADLSVNLTGVSATPAIGIGTVTIDSPPLVSVNLTGVAATPSIGTGHVAIEGEVIAPPEQGLVAGGGRWYGLPEDAKVYLTGVAANPQVGKITAKPRGTLDELYRMYPFPRKVEERPLPVARKKAKSPKPTAFVYMAGVHPTPKIGSVTTKAFYEDNDEELTSMLKMMDVDDDLIMALKLSK